MTNFFVLSIFGQFDYELESRLLKSENRFHAQHLLPHAVDKLTDDHVATIYEAYQAGADQGDPHEIPQKFSRLLPLGAIFLSAPP